MRTQREEVSGGKSPCPQGILDISLTLSKGILDISLTLKDKISILPLKV